MIPSIYFRRLQHTQPHEYIEFRCLRYGKTDQFWTTHDQLSTAIDRINEADYNGWTIYCGVNPRQKNKANKAGVTSVVSFAVDLDSGFPFEWPDDVPKPTMIVASGSSNGRHLYWELNTAVPPSSWCDAVNTGLAIRLNGDRKCRDISRVLRVPGTTHHIYGYCVELLEANDFRYEAKDFEHLAAFGSEHIGAPRQTTQQKCFPPPSQELLARFNWTRTTDRRLTAAYRGELGDGSSDSRYVLAARLFDTGEYTADEIGSLIVHHRWFNVRHKKVCPPDRVLRDANRLLGLFAAEPHQVRGEIRS